MNLLSISVIFVLVLLGRRARQQEKWALQQIAELRNLQGARGSRQNSRQHGPKGKTGASRKRIVSVCRNNN